MLTLTLCLLILAGTLWHRPVEELVSKLKDVDWSKAAGHAWKQITRFAKGLGRSVTRVALVFYYVFSEGNLSTLDKALVYAGLIYIVVPNDLLPRKALKWVGMLDDAAVAIWISRKIESQITPEIERKVESTLDDWFGPVIIIGPANN